MPDDFAVATAAPRLARIGGVDYRVAKFTPRDLGDLTSFLKSHVPDPRLAARELCRDLPDAVAIEVWRDLSEEAKDWPPSPMDANGNRILTTTTEGAAHVLWVLLRKHQPAVDLDRARRLAEDIGYDELIALINMGFPEPSFLPNSPGAPTTTEDRGPVPIA